MARWYQKNCEKVIGNRIVNETYKKILFKFMDSTKDRIMKKTSKKAAKKDYAPILHEKYSEKLFDSTFLNSLTPSEATELRPACRQFRSEFKEFARKIKDSDLTEFFAPTISNRFFPEEFKKFKEYFCEEIDK